jgi:hypothetical protein
MKQWLQCKMDPQITFIRSTVHKQIAARGYDRMTACQAGCRLLERLMFGETVAFVEARGQLHGSAE